MKTFKEESIFEDVHSHIFDILAWEGEKTFSSIILEGKLKLLWSKNRDLQNQSLWKQSKIK